METKTIPPAQWRTLFDSLARIHGGDAATLEILAADLGAQMEVEDAPLSGISYDSSGLELHFAPHGGHVVHRIAKPKRVAIEEGEDGLVAAIEIEADGEPTRVLRLSAPVAARLLTA